MAEQVSGVEAEPEAQASLPQVLQGSGFRVQSTGFRIQDSGCRAQLEAQASLPQVRKSDPDFITAFAPNVGPFSTFRLEGFHAFKWL